jgi:hypothetical protein
VLAKTKARIEKDIIKTRESIDETAGDEDTSAALLELEKLLHQTEDELLQAKKRLYFPNRYRLTHGSLEDGVFVGIEDVLVEKVQASFTMKVGPAHPQVALRLVGQQEGRGVAVAFRAQHMKLVGESGSHCPNLSLEQVSIQAEVVVEIPLAFSSSSSKKGVSSSHKRWRAQKSEMKFKLLSFTNQIKGLVDLPPLLIKRLVNSIMPMVLRMVLPSLLPVELGSYIDTHSSPLATIRGNFCLSGEALSTGDTQLTEAVLGYEKWAHIKMLGLGEEEVGVCIPHAHSTPPPPCHLHSHTHPGCCVH